MMMIRLERNISMFLTSCHIDRRMTLNTWKYYTGAHPRRQIQDWKKIMCQDFQDALTSRDYCIIIDPKCTKRYFGGDEAMAEQKRVYREKGGSGESIATIHAGSRALLQKVAINAKIYERGEYRGLWVCQYSYVLDLLDWLGEQRPKSANRHT